jgi:hypothetical protein
MTTLSSSSRALIVFDNGHICLAPPPDSAEDSGADLNIAFPLSVSSSTGGAGTYEDQIPLGGRGGNALVTRDLIFETCLSEQRHDLTRQEKLDRWDRMLDAIVKINGHPLDPAGTTVNQAPTAAPVPETLVGRRPRSEE